MLWRLMQLPCRYCRTISFMIASCYDVSIYLCNEVAVLRNGQLVSFLMTYGSVDVITLYSMISAQNKRSIYDRQENFADSQFICIYRQEISFFDDINFYFNHHLYRH